MNFPQDIGQEVLNSRRDYEVKYPEHDDPIRTYIDPLVPNTKARGTQLLLQSSI